jgi:YihY family inner membrane protein
MASAAPASHAKEKQGPSKLERFDRWQQQRSWTGLPMAVFKKFSDDQSTNLASMVAFWAFFSIFPLLLVFVTVLAYVIPNASTKANVLQHVAAFFPLLHANEINTLSGTWWTLLVGLVTALWSGLAVVKTLQNAFNAVWEVPMAERPKFVEKTKRAVLVLATIGLGLVISTVISSFVTGTATGIHLGWFGRLAGYVIAIVLDIGLLVAAFRMLTDRNITTRDVLPGAVFAGVVFWILQQLSSFIISRHLQSAQGTYGSFATVITMLWWFYLQGQVTLLGAQLNVVLKRHLWPRSLIGGPDTHADHQAYEQYAEERRYHHEEEVDTRFRGR